MIDIRTTVIGADKVAATLAKAPHLIDFHVTSEFVAIGLEITDEAKARVPVRKGSLRDAIRFTVNGSGSATKATGDKNAKLEVKHSGKGARHAHLIERGVAEQTISVHERFRAQKIRSFAAGKARKGRLYWAKGSLVYQRRHHVKAQPYFMPAVAKVGDVGARLQDAVARAAEEAGGA